MSVSCVMQGPDPSLAYRPNIEPKKTKEEYRNFEVMVRKCVCFMRDIFDCELLNGQNDECQSGTDASDGNDLSKKLWSPRFLSHCFGIVYSKKIPMSIKEVKCPKVLTCQLLSRKRLNLIKCYKFTFLLHLCFSERISVRPRL